MSYKVVGTFTQVNTLRKYVPDVELFDAEFILQGRKFERWYDKNKKVIHMLAAATPLVASVLFGLTLPQLARTANASSFIGSIPAFHTVDPASSVAYQVIDGAASMAVSAAAATGLFTGGGSILMHILMLGFVMLIVTTFLKLTGRGEWIPLVVFISGGIVLKEVISLFNDIYGAVKMFLTV